MTLRERFRQELTGHLSDEKTEVDVNTATRIAEDFAIGFADWMFRSAFNKEIDWSLTTKELLEIYKKENEQS